MSDPPKGSIIHTAPTLGRGSPRRRCWRTACPIRGEGLVASASFFDTAGKRDARRLRPKPDAEYKAFFCFFPGH
jgi:hypothetical protein